MAHERLNAEKKPGGIKGGAVPGALAGILEPAHYHGLAGRLGGISHVYDQELQRAIPLSAVGSMAAPAAMGEGDGKVMRLT